MGEPTFFTVRSDVVPDCKSVTFYAAKENRPFTLRDTLAGMRRFFWLQLVTVAMAQNPGYQPVGTMSQLMIHIIYPSSDAIFYVDRHPPSNDVEWNALANQALVLAESGNLLLMPGRARDTAAWVKDAKLMIDAGAAAYKAAKAKDIEAVRAVNDALYASCVTCHAQYRDQYLKPKRQ